jgi:hypothetical protein
MIRGSIMLTATIGSTWMNPFTVRELTDPRSQHTTMTTAKIATATSSEVCMESAHVRITQRDSSGGPERSFA